MSIQVALHHRTVYRYDRLVALGPQTLRLRPAPHSRTPIISYSLSVTPKDHFINWQQDPQSNYLARLVFPERTTEFVIEVDLVADMAVYNPFDFFLEATAETFPFAYPPELETELAAYRIVEPVGPLLARWLAAVDRAPRQTTDFVVALNQRLQGDIAYVIRMEPGIQSCEETLSRGSGSCRDTGWLFVQILRHLGFAARFVSGYLIQLTPDVKPLTGPEGPAHDFTDLHAWAEVYLPGAGWIGLDPTSGLLAGEGHIPLAATPAPPSAAPVTGGVDKCEVSFSYEMSVTRVRETPRVTKPYSEDQWQGIDRLGHAIDRDIAAAGINLTMGGEPTFISIDDMDGAEWNVAALGPAKRRLAGDLLRRLQVRWAPGALLHYGQGKWYPGEPLPRWALGCFWRKDGEPMWRDPSRFAADRVGPALGIREAEHFAAELARRLQLDPSFLVPGFEDPWYYVVKERQLPVNVDPHNADLTDDAERARLAKLLDRGLGTATGFALPIQRVRGNGGDHWVSAEWTFRAGRMYLLPGDSPMGYRLPLDSLAPAPEGMGPQFFDRDPYEPRGPLPARDRLFVRNANGQGSTGSYAEQIPSDTSPFLRTALCVEPRDGRLHIFMPPVMDALDYIELLAAVEDTITDQGLSLVVEGYPPPRDPRLGHFSVTPDPGVIEVNIHPSANWSELVETTTTLYEEARQTRLGTEKFLVDGRHVGTGGGNHVTIGGPTVAESPMLRRPDLVKSLIGYWLNHPSLSYLFSGLHIGPTSQAPRIDEARTDSVAELELAFSQISDDGSAPPWLVDRVLRHILVDVTGNTHRTEFCIDKLYSPDGPTGRLGLVEMRAFEMPPNARMSLVQQLLLRGLIAEFTRRPYKRRLVRWNTVLHDKFLLPHFVDADFADVIGDLNAAGYAFEQDWFAPHFEFRFPEIGAVTYGGITVELRQALEPWPVLGEETGPGGTVRYVDSSLERLQVKVRNMVNGRHEIACNGVRLALHPTGTVGEFVAGVRYRAWQPVSGLHPTIGVNTPLVVDVVDTWSGRSIGGCTYHVAHPGGRNYETLPVNANEAEARRRARFFPVGHTGGAGAIRSPVALGEFPLTLDLRYAG